MKGDLTIIRKALAGTHKEIITKLDYPTPKCPYCPRQKTKYDFQKKSK